MVQLAVDFPVDFVHLAARQKRISGAELFGVRIIFDVSFGREHVEACMSTALQDVQGSEMTQRQRRRGTAAERSDVDGLDGGNADDHELPVSSWPSIMQQMMPQKRHADQSATTTEAKRQRTSHSVSRLYTSVVCPMNA